MYLDGHRYKIVSLKMPSTVNWIQSTFVVSPCYCLTSLMCLLSHRLFRTSSLPCDPRSLFNSLVYIYLSLYTLPPSECWSCPVPSNQYARLLRFSERHPLFWIYNFCLLLLICLPSVLRFMTFALFICERFLHALLYLYPLDFWFWLLPVFFTIVLPVDFVSRIPDYLTTKLLHIKDIAHSLPERNGMI